MIARTTIVFIVALALLPTVSAQSLEEPLVAHADGKADAAQSDPVKFAQDHASEQAVADEAEWGVAYGCFAVDYAHEEVGTPDPDLDQCEQYEEVLGIAPDPEEPVAIVENATEDPVAIVEEAEEEILSSVDELVEDPLSAPEILVGLVLYLVDKVLDIIGGVGATATDLVDGVLELVGAALLADVKLGSGMYDASGDAVASAASGIVAVVTGAASGIGTAAAGIGSMVGTAGQAVGDGASDALDAVGDAAAAVSSAVSDFVAELLGDSKKTEPAEAPTGDLELPDTTDPLDGLLDGATDLVGKTT